MSKWRNRNGMIPVTRPGLPDNHSPFLDAFNESTFVRGFFTSCNDKMKKLHTLLTAGILLLNYYGYSQVKTADQSTTWYLLNQTIQLSPKWTILSNEIFAFVEGQKM